MNGTLLYSQDEINQLHDLSLTGYSEVVRDRVIIGYYHLLNAREMIHGLMDESLVKEGNVLHIGEFGVYKRARLVPLHPVTQPIFEKHKFNIPLVDYKTFKLHLKAIIQLSGIKGRLYGRSEKEAIPAEKLDELITPQVIYNSAAANLLQQTSDTRLHITLLMQKPPRGSFIFPYSFEEMKAHYFQEAVRGWKASTPIPPLS